MRRSTRPRSTAGRAVKTLLAMGTLLVAVGLASPAVASAAPCLSGSPRYRSTVTPGYAQDGDDRATGGSRSRQSARTPAQGRFTSGSPRLTPAGQVRTTRTSVRADAPANRNAPAVAPAKSA